VDYEGTHNVKILAEKFTLVGGLAG